jgi:hypothetical protein
VADALVGATASGKPGNSTAVTTTTREGISISLVREPSAQTTGVVTVSLPKETATAGSGFSFPLPVQVATSANKTTVQVTTASGGKLPSWLRFNPATKTFVASAVPSGAFPMQVTITIGGQKTSLVISERGSK